jgi:hypothetical protein
LKVDHLLPAFLSECKLEPGFQFGEKFEHEKVLDKKRRQRNKRRILKAKRQSILEGKEFHADAVPGLIFGTNGVDPWDEVVSSDGELDIDAQSSEDETPRVEIPDLPSPNLLLNQDALSPKSRLVDPISPK